MIMGTIRKILLILKTPPPYGGGEICAAALHDYVKYEPDFRVLDFSSNKRNKASQGKFEVWKIGEFVRQWIKFVKTLIREKPRLIFLSLPKSLLPFIRDSLFVWTSLVFGVDCVGELAGMEFYFINESRFGRWYGKLVLSKMKCIRTLGRGIASELHKLGITNTIITDNGVSVRRYASRDAQRKDKVTKLLFVGCISPAKGWDTLLIAFIDLIQKGHKVELNVIGEWSGIDYKKKIELLIAQYKINEKIHFYGLKLDEDKWKIFSESHIFVLPSLREGQPLTILEAIGCGIPVVATKVGAIPETIEDGTNGYLFDPGSTRELVDIIERLIVNSQLRGSISTANLLLFKKRFTLERFLHNQVHWLRACACGTLIVSRQRW